MTKRENPAVPLSWGELIDKITILEIKQTRLSGAARENVARELAALAPLAASILAEDSEAAALKIELKAVNEKLWQIEDDIRDKEAASAFDAEFIALARSVYQNNDARGALKRRINIRLNSDLMEEKLYKDYGKGR